MSFSASGQLLAAVELMRRQLAVELGSEGARTVTLRTGGIPESIPASSSCPASGVR